MISKNQKRSFQEAMIACSASPFLFGMWISAFGFLLLASGGAELQAGAFRGIAVFFFFFNAIFYILLSPKDSDGRAFNSFLFGPIFYMWTNGLMGLFDRMNYNSNTMLFEFVLITIVGFFLINRHRTVRE